MRTPAAALALLCFAAAPAAADPDRWRAEWPETDFSKAAVDFSEILSGGPPKDGIPAIDDPVFAPAADVAGDLPDREPVIALEIAGDLRAYPLRVLMWHEIVNDTVGGVPVAVTYCPLCNSAVVFEREVAGTPLDFGTTGKLRHSDLVMYDRQTESWWQQFTGEAIVGALTGTRLGMIPARVESFARFRGRGDHGRVLVPREAAGRAYGVNPYAGYDGRERPYPFFQGELPDGIPALARVVAVGDEAWSLALLREKGEIRARDLVLRWVPGQASALDTGRIAEGRDIGNVIVRRETAEGAEDVVHDTAFAFAFHAFHPDGTIHTQKTSPSARPATSPP